ncbi:S8 family peptidase [Blastococcus sp. SYSU DS0539]
MLRNLEGLADQISAQRVALPRVSSAIVAVEGQNLGDAGEELAAVGQVLSFDAERDVATIRISDQGRGLRGTVLQYRDQETSFGNPRNRNLVNRVDRLRLASLADLSLGEIEEAAISPDFHYWVEVWVPNAGDPNGAAFIDRRAEVEALASLVDEPDRVPVSIGPERNVYLVRITGEILREVPALLADIAVEVHIAQAARLVELAERSDDLGQPVVVNPAPIEANVVAVHDTGVRSAHPYIRAALLGVDSAVPGVDGEDRHGHGTEMAGLALYDDLAASIVAESITPEHWLVAIRLLDDSADGVELWAERQTLAVQLAESYAEGREVVHNVSIGAYNPRPGQRTSWSVSIDQAAWNEGRGRLLVVAAGNASAIADPALYPSTNLAEVHEQPAQAWNALTVGAVTDLTTLTATDVSLGAPPPLAQPGQLSPYTTTAPPGNLPIKPEIVMEGGNSAPGGGLEGSGLQGLSILTTGFRSRGLLERTWATSAAAAQASFALARLASMHPGLRLATIRGLLVHSATWPEGTVAQLGDKRDILRAIGYGRPDLTRMGVSDSNRVVLVHEGEVSGAGSSEERTALFIHVPLPDFGAMGFGDVSARLTVTLSYFVDPTDNLIRRDYAGARLRWDMQGPLEEADDFIQRANAASRSSSYVGGGPGSFPWTVGITARSRGTLQQDWTTASAAEISGERLIAIQPVYGWWSEREAYMSQKLPFSLVVSVDLGDVDVELYAEVEQLLTVDVEVDAS